MQLTLVIYETVESVGVAKVEVSEANKWTPDMEHNYVKINSNCKIGLCYIIDSKIIKETEHFTSIAEAVGEIVTQLVSLNSR